MLLGYWHDLIIGALVCIAWAGACCIVEHWRDWRGET